MLKNDTKINFNDKPEKIIDHIAKNIDNYNEIENKLETLFVIDLDLAKKEEEIIFFLKESMDNMEATIA
jgi:hypothetical protein